MTLAVPGYALRTMRTSDAQNLYEALSQPEVGLYLADWYPQDGYTLEMAQEWVNGGAGAFGGVVWAITFNDIVVGSAGIHPQHGFARCNAEIGYWLSETHWGRGVGTAVVDVLVAKAFEMQEITRVFAPIHVANLASQRICEKNGFVREGLQRQSVMRWGQAIDVVVWARYRNH